MCAKPNDFKHSLDRALDPFPLLPGCFLGRLLDLLTFALACKITSSHTPKDQTPLPSLLPNQEEATKTQQGRTYNYLVMKKPHKTPEGSWENWPLLAPPQNTALPWKIFYTSGNTNTRAHTHTYPLEFRILAMLHPKLPVQFSSHTNPSLYTSVVLKPGYL